jgi:hypothetical protein
MYKLIIFFRKGTGSDFSMESPFLAFCGDDIAAVEIEDGWKVSPQRYMTECKVYEMKISEKPRGGERTNSTSIQDDQKAMKTDKSTGDEKGGRVFGNVLYMLKFLGNRPGLVAISSIARALKQKTTVSPNNGTRVTKSPPSKSL